MVRRKYQKKEIVLAAVCLLLAVATLTFYIWHQSALISLGYQTSGLEMRVERLEVEIKKLETDKAALLAPDRVEEIARNKLNLTDPSDGQIIYEDFLVSKKDE
jgi:cell division protein FtsL